MGLGISSLGFTSYGLAQNASEQPFCFELATASNLGILELSLGGRALGFRGKLLFRDGALPTVYDIFVLEQWSLVVWGRK